MFKKGKCNDCFRRLSHYEFLKRYNIALKHMDPVMNSHVTFPQAKSPRTIESASPRVPALERLKRRSRRRHRSSYDHTRHICRSILEIVKVDSDEVKENVLESGSHGVKIGRTKVFLREETVSHDRAVEKFFLTDVGPGLYTRVILEFKHDNLNMRGEGRGGGTCILVRTALSHALLRLCPTYL